MKRRPPGFTRTDTLFHCTALFRSSSKSSPGSGGLANWRSQHNIQVRIRRVLQGKENMHIVPASAFAHEKIRDDRDFLAVLRPDGEGGYTLMTANLWAYRPKISGPCS